MINNSFEAILTRHLAYIPTENQSEAINFLLDFIFSNEDNSLFLFKGYAGTGKTSLAGALVKALTEQKIKTVLLAPTGRAAKVFSQYAECKASTIHRKIYRLKTSASEQDGFTQAQNLYRNTIFIVDEASMIANMETNSSLFGSGRLLDDLIRFVYSGYGCRLILMGDDAQLPPVMLSESPALSADFLSGYGLKVTEFKLTQIVRQGDKSGILVNATSLRDALRCGNVSRLPAFDLKAGADVRRLDNCDVLEELSSAYSRDGVDETMVIVRSNKQAKMYNSGIRSRIFDYEEELSAGDRLMVTRNSYLSTAAEGEMDFLANGELMRIIRVKKTEEVYDLRFASVTAAFDGHDFELEIEVNLTSLQSEGAGLPNNLYENLFRALWENYSDVKSKSERLKTIRSDIYYNAVNVKYAYSVTCHKAQGGQWTNIFLDIGYVKDEMCNEDFYRWLYTAVTRASSRLFLVNLPDALVSV